MESLKLLIRNINFTDVSESDGRHVLFVEAPSLGGTAHSGDGRHRRL